MPFALRCKCADAMPAAAPAAQWLRGGAQAARSVDEVVEGQWRQRHAAVRAEGGFARTQPSRARRGTCASALLRRSLGRGGSLGLASVISETGKFLHQSSYAHTMLDRFKGQRPVAKQSTPGTPSNFDPEENIAEGPEQDAAHIRFWRKAVTLLLCLVTGTRPDKACTYTVEASMTTRCPKKVAACARHMLGYLKFIRELGVMEGKEHAR